MIIKIIHYAVNTIDSNSYNNKVLIPNLLRLAINFNKLIKVSHMYLVL